MRTVQQGDVLKIPGIQFPVIVVSNDLFNQSGSAIACPIVDRAQEGPLHIKLHDENPHLNNKIVLCEQVRYLDLSTRHFSKLTASRYFDFMDISDAVVGIFEYQ